jgi:hypothetical protein
MIDLRVACETLRAGKATDGWLGQWLPSTHEAPDQFEHALYAYASSRREGPKSHPGQAYDFYHDCVVAHTGHDRRALAVRQSPEELTELSFEALDRRCSALAAAWKTAGVEPGQSIGIVLPVGIDYAIGLLTALRMRLVISPLPPLGPAFVRNRLELLAPDHIVTSERYGKMLGRFAGSVLPVTAAREAIGKPSQSYAPDDVVLRIFSPFAEACAEPLAVVASVLHRSILRDALLVFCLDGSDTLAAPDFEPMQFQPNLLLAALCAGASFAQFSSEHVEGNPKTLEDLRVTVLGVRRKLREILLRRGVDWFKSAGRGWFRSLTDALDVERWDELGRAVLGQKAHGFNVVANAATGGVQLFSPRAPSALGLRVFPVPGQQWQLSEVGAGALPALNEAGVYMPIREGKPDESFPGFLVARHGEGFFFAGAMELGRNAEMYPADEAAAAVRSHPLVEHAVAFVAPGRWMNDGKVVLLVFVDDVRGPDGRFAPPVTVPELNALITREIGERFLPDRTEVFPLRPRFTDGEIDRTWCRSQYLSGALTAKARSELFVLLSRLGTILGAESADDSPA